MGCTFVSVKLLTLQPANPTLRPHLCQLVRCYESVNYDSLSHPVAAGAFGIACIRQIMHLEEDTFGIFRRILTDS